MIEKGEINKLVSCEELKQYTQNANWYHTIKITDGITTAGVYDHQENLVKYGFPANLQNKEVLDVGCSNGYFAFELEKRGAKSVLAVDTDTFDGQPAISPSPSKLGAYQEKYQRAFYQNNKFIELAQKFGLDKVQHILILKKLLDSHIEYKNLSIYNLKELNRQFDLVFCGDLIEHLKNPLEAVESLRSVCREKCIIALSNSLELPKILYWVNLIPSLRNRLITYYGDSGGTFFHFHPETFKKVLIACGFKNVVIYSKFNLWNKKHNCPVPHVIYHCEV